MGSTLTGSAPKATFSTQPTIMPSQDQLLNDLVGIFETGDPVKGVQPYGGSYAAPLNSLQNTSLAGLEESALAAANPQAPPSVSKTGQQTSSIDQMFNTLSGVLNFAAPKIDSTEAFQKGVVDPVTANFNKQVLPALDARAARSAGGAYSSGREQGNLTAANDLTTTLGQQGSTFAYNAAAANQQADLSANQQRLAALGVAPAITQFPTQLDTSIASANQGFADNSMNQTINRLLQTLQGGSVPYNVAQTQVQGEYNEFGRQQTEEQQIIADMIAAALGSTVQTSGVGSGGSSGLLGSLLGGLGTLGGAFIKSDERLKEDIEEIGDVDGIPLYRYRYKPGEGAPGPHLGFMAQDVERRVPSAVRADSRGFKSVNYGAVLADVLEAA